MAIYAKDLREQRAKLVADARALVDRANPSAEDSAKFDDLMAKADDLKAQIDRIERADDVERDLSARIDSRARHTGVSTDQAAAESQAEDRAFSAFMRSGMNGLTDEQRSVMTRRVADVQNAQSTGTGSSGGYTVPSGLYHQLIDAQLAFGGMLTEAYVFETESGNQLPIPTDNDTSNEGAIIGENTTVASQDIAFGQVTLNAYMYHSKAVLVSLQLLQDSAFDLNSFLVDKLGTRIARITNRHFTVGTGSGQPNGLVTASTTGQTGASGQTASIIYDDLVELEHSVDPAYRAKAKFMFHDQTLKTLKKLKDGYGRPLWLPGIAVKEPDTINGYGYAVNQHMPTMAADAKSVVFGDLKSYFIRRVNNPIVMRLAERYADAGQVGFIVWQRFDGTLVDAGTHPVKAYANSHT